MGLSMEGSMGLMECLIEQPLECSCGGENGAIDGDGWHHLTQGWLRWHALNQHISHYDQIVYTSTAQDFDLRQRSVIEFLNYDICFIKYRHHWVWQAPKLTIENPLVVKLPPPEEPKVM